ncbi:MAG: hypothetical protein KDB80_09705 [Planctomycetes bacterium]|nr:hypothetical protein [Planctomycetota bacterium]
MLTLALVAALVAAPVPQPQPPHTQAQYLPRYPAFDRLYCADVDGSYCDEYYIDGPTLQAGEKYPLVIMFHGFGERANEAISLNGNGWYPGARAFMDAAKAWTTGPKPYIVVFHDGGMGSFNPPNLTANTYGAESFMRATEAVLEDVVSKWPVDRKRMYGYGLSMGGGECVAYAARHQDPTSKTMLSAVVDHSGTVSTTRLYHLGSGQIQWQNMYGAPPYGSSLAADFLYQRATALDLPFDGTVTSPLDYVLKHDFHLAHNLRWLPRMNFHAGPSIDDLKQMVEPIDAFEAFLADPVLVDAPDRVPFPPVANSVHSWNAIAPADILDYFDARKKADTLTLFSTQLPQGSPAQAEMLMFAEDGVRHQCYSVVRQDPTLWGRLHVFLWKPYFSNLNAIVFEREADNATDNIAEVTIWFDQHLKWVDWGAGDTVAIAAQGVDLGTIRTEGAGAPTGVDVWDGSNYVPAAPTDWSHAGTTLELYEDPLTQVQRRWRVHY